MKTAYRLALSAAAALLLPIGVAAAKTVDVRAVVTNFRPEVVFIKPGDTVHWANMTGHMTASYPGMIPKGAKPWQSQLGQDYEQTFTVPGVYVYRCIPHESMGMTGSIVVGPLPPKNLNALLSNPHAKGGMEGREVRIMQRALTKKMAQ